MTAKQPITDEQRTALLGQIVNGLLSTGNYQTPKGVDSARIAAVALEILQRIEEAL